MKGFKISLPLWRLLQGPFEHVGVLLCVRWKGKKQNTDFGGLSGKNSDEEHKLRNLVLQYRFPLCDLFRAHWRMLLLFSV